MPHDGAASDAEGDVVEVGGDDRLLLVAEGRLVELGDQRAVDGEEFVPGGGAGDAGDVRAEVLHRLPDAEDGARGIGGDRQAARLSGVQRADTDGASAVPHGLRRQVRVGRGEVRRPGDGEMAVGRQLADARHLAPVEQCPHIRAELLGPGLELPAEQRPVEVLGRRHPVHHQAHPAGCARCIGRTVQAGRPPCLGHRHSLLGPSLRPCPSALRRRVPRPRAITTRADARTTRNATGPRRTAARRVRVRGCPARRYRSLSAAPPCGVHRLYGLCPIPYAS